MLLSGESVKASEASGWLVDYAGSMEDSIKAAWEMAAGISKVKERPLTDGAFDVPMDVRLPAATNGSEAGRSAIADCIKQSCAAPLGEAISVQAKLAGQFMAGKHCREGRIGADAAKTLAV
jgi:hypothetical protein